MDHLELLRRPSEIVAERTSRRGGRRLVVVSNRVPSRSFAASPSAGGLAVALASALKARGGLWFGWSGESCKEAEPSLQINADGPITYAVSGLSRRDIEEYYHGFANRGLWPICHYRLDLACLSDCNAATYFRVNERFASQLQKLLRPDDLIWVHDYHLIPLASYLRELGCRNRIGFFLHIPWPPPEVASALPAYERLLRAFGAYDVVGFQTVTDAVNFCACIEGAKVGWHAGGEWCEIGGRMVEVRAFPISIDPGDFAKKARAAKKSSTVKRTLASFEGRKFIIGVDRLDYSKGLKHRMEAFATFLERSPMAARDRVTLLQITPKSRSEVPEYALLQRELAEQVGRINGKFGDVDWTPLRYINKTMSRPALAGLYRHARVGLVTPLRDGMNLVAKEYVAAQAPDNPGVLVLSQFAGAAQELKSALIVNPYDIDGTAAAISAAFAMPLEERKQRWSDLIGTLRANSIHDWTAQFLKALEGLEAVGGVAEEAGIGRPLIGGLPAVAGLSAHPEFRTGASRIALRAPEDLALAKS
jgi:trehalose 6-phosphate synthase